MKINTHLLLLLRIKGWRLWLFSVTLSIMLTEAAVSGMGLLLKGQVTYDYLLTGLVASGFVASLVVAFLSHFLSRLADSHLQLHAIIEATPECIKLLDRNGVVLQVNRAGLEMIEADSLEQVIGLPAQNTLLPRYRDDFAALLASVFAGQTVNMEMEVKGLKGTLRWLEMRAVPLRDASGAIHALLGVTRDITSQKAAETDLRIAAIAFESQEGVIITDSSNKILRVNKAFTRITGFHDWEVIGQNPNILRSGRQDAGFYAAMWDSLERTGGWEGEISNRRKNGEIYLEQLAISVVRDSNGAVTHYVGALADITRSRAADDTIKYLAFYDPLTGLPNQALLRDRLITALAASHRNNWHGALLFIDLDNFKTLNDTLGHDMGDLLLQKASERLVACVRDTDTVARFGGDEFVVMLNGLSKVADEAIRQIELIGDKIMEAFSRPYQLGSHHYQSTPSIGVTLFQGQKQSIDELLKQADIAMYQAKAAGRNVLCFFDPHMQSRIENRVSMEKDLKQALAENQFQLYYQPQSLHNRAVVGAEALIRWEHPQRGMVSPMDFIALAEETDLILPIGQWVLETACAQLKSWQGQAHTRHLVLAVNVSARQFHQYDFVAQVKQAISQSGIDPERLKLELTESLVLDNMDDTIQKMLVLREEVGVSFSMDDFGTGYSSLSSLKKLPLSQLKIDQSFVRDITDNIDDAVIVQTIIAMAKSLGMEVIAEGVETEQQRQFLKRNGCPVIQGYLFGRPMPIVEFDAFLAELADRREN